MALRLGGLLVAVGCAGVLGLGYRLCTGVGRGDLDASLGGEVNAVGLLALGSLLAVGVGAVLLLVSTRGGRRPGWVAFLLVLGAVVPASVALWFGLLCRLLR